MHTRGRRKAPSFFAGRPASGNPVGQAECANRRRSLKFSFRRPSGCPQFPVAAPFNTWPTGACCRCGTFYFMLTLAQADASRATPGTMLLGRSTRGCLKRLHAAGQMARAVFPAGAGFDSATTRQLIKPGASGHAPEVGLCGLSLDADQSRINVLLPNRLSTRSTARIAVRLWSSKAGFISMISSEPMPPRSAIISMHNCASR